VLIFRLSSVLGGRDQVLKTPFSELLAYVSMAKDKDQSERFANFMNMFYANPMTDQKGRKDYIKKITPDNQSGSVTTKVLGKGKSTVTNLDQLRLLKQMQEQERQALQK
jgi:hypothetical protein